VAVAKAQGASKPKKLQRLFKRVVPKQWEDELAEISPSQSRFIWLKLIYEEGYPWEPVERYMIYQMTPERLMTKGTMMEYILEQLKDPDPPSAHGNYYDTVLEEFVRNPDCLITERAWHLYRETGCWGRPYWVIQGEKGGHKRWFTTVEKQLLRLAKLPTEPPAPGDLPYAEWDERVKKNLQILDMLRGEHGERRRAAAVAKGHSVQEEHEKEQQLELRKRLVAFLHEQVNEIAPDAHQAMLKVDAGRKQTTRAEQIKIEKFYEQAEYDFITTGSSKSSLITRR
jgi:hypothetical protein